VCDLRPLKEENGKFIPDPDAPKLVKKDISLHTLRHSFASIGADMGYVELTIAGLLGHKLGTITSRYSHNVDASLINAADKISIKIDGALKGSDTTDNVIQFRKSI
jgi:integrase